MSNWIRVAVLRPVGGRRGAAGGRHRRVRFRCRRPARSPANTFQAAVGRSARRAKSAARPAAPVGRRSNGPSRRTPHRLPVSASAGVGGRGRPEAVPPAWTMARSRRRERQRLTYHGAAGGRPPIAAKSACQAAAAAPAAAECRGPDRRRAAAPRMAPGCRRRAGRRRPAPPGGRRPRTSMLFRSIATSPSAAATVSSGGVGAGCGDAVRQRVPAAGAGPGLAAREVRGRPRRVRRRDVRLALHVHQVLDALADLGRHQLHALRQIAGERLRLVPGRFAHRRGIARVRVERHRGQRNDRQEEERDDQTKAQTHSRRGMPLRQVWPEIAGKISPVRRHGVPVRAAALRPAREARPPAGRPLRQRVAASRAPYEMRIEQGDASANAEPGIAATRCSRISRSAQGHRVEPRMRAHQVVERAVGRRHVARHVVFRSACRRSAGGSRPAVRGGPRVGPADRQRRQRGVLRDRGRADQQRVLDLVDGLGERRPESPCSRSASWPCRRPSTASTSEMVCAAAPSIEPGEKWRDAAVGEVLVGLVVNVEHAARRGRAR